MPRRIRPELSKSNRYWIPKHRYYELKHFCLQYNDWKKELDRYNYFKKPYSEHVDGGSVSDLTANSALYFAEMENNVDMIKDCCKRADECLSKWLFIGITEDLPYDTLRTLHDIPCCRETYYDRYHRFFWYLSKAKH